MKLTDMTGQTFGSWTVLSVAQRGRRTRWLCRCACGTEKSVCSYDLRNGKTSKCDPCSRKQNVTHGMTKTSTYGIWRGMIFRCTKPSSKIYANYGGRGISVCERWRTDFANFLEDMGERPEGMSLDRIDVNGNYEPENCRWATGKQQQRNRRRNHYITANGETLTLTEWTERTGMSWSGIKRRLRIGLTPEQAVTLPKRSAAVVRLGLIASRVRPAVCI